MPRKRRRANLPLRFVVFGSVGFFLIYVLILPVLAHFLSWEVTGSGYHGSIYSLLDTVSLRFGEVFFASWFFFVGSAIGSFANVVVYRVPRRKSVIIADSACPYCRQKIKRRHNIPILGWLLLRGRCYACRLPISRRYPVVELLFGLTFLALYATTLVTTGNNIPGWGGQVSVRLVYLITDPNWEVIGIYVFHCCLMSLLWTWALIEKDGFALPLSTIAFAAIVGFGFPWSFGFLHPLDWRGLTFSDTNDSSWLNGLAVGLIGFVVGTALGMVSYCLLATWRQSRTRNALVCGFAAIGVYMGWQAAMSSWLLFSVLCLASIPLARFSRYLADLPRAFILALAVIIQICFWRQISSLWGFPGEQSSLFELLVALLAGLSMMFVVRVASLFRRGEGAHKVGESCPP